MTFNARNSKAGILDELADNHGRETLAHLLKYVLETTAFGKEDWSKNAI